MTTPARVLDGITVLEVASFIAGPAAATVMSDFGAEVIKVEPPGEGDPYRALVDLPGMPASEHNYPWHLDARNKKSVVLDLRVAEGRQVLHELVARADVFVTNFPPAALARLGLGWEELSPVNPRLVYAWITGYGEIGPEAGKPGYDINAWWARSGLMDIVRPAGGPPASSVPGMGDHPTAMALFGAVMLALYQRERTGRGGRVTTSLMANGAWANAVLIQAALAGAPLVRRPPREQGPNALANLYRCRDGRWFIRTILREERNWGRFTRALGRPELAADPRFATTERRRANAPALVATLDVVFAERDWAEWRPALEAHDIPFGAIARVEDLPDDRQMADTQTFAAFEGPEAPPFRTVMSPIQLEGQSKAPPRRAAVLGEHTLSVLRALGHDDAAIARLRDAGALG